MRIDIITPAFDVAPYIGDAIRSVLAQTHRYWTMTVVDDGSTDETAIVTPVSTIHAFDCSANGMPGCRRRAISAWWPRTPRRCCFSTPTLAQSDALSPFRRRCGRTNAIAAVGPYQRVADGAPVGGKVRPASFRRSAETAAGAQPVRQWRTSHDPPTMVETAGTFDPGLSYGEDWEYWIRLARFGSFTAAQGGAPLLFVRERAHGACLGMASCPELFLPCMDAIYNAPGLKSRFSAGDLARLRGRAEAENDWIVGRELMRHGQRADGRSFLRRSVLAAPSLKRLALLAAGSLPIPRFGPFRSYGMPETV